MKRLLILVALFTFAAFAAADTIHVPDDYGTIQGAIDAAVDRDTIIVRPGTYDENIDFRGKAIRLKSEEGPDNTIIDGGNPVDPDYGSVVMFVTGERSDSVLEGFTVTNGTGLLGTDGNRYGGGIITANESSPTIIHNIITGNSVNFVGGGIFCFEGSSPTIAFNTITENETTGPLGSGGAGIMCGGDCSPLITNNIIANNTATNDGAGIYCYSNCSPVISNNVISGNRATSAESWGGAITCYINSSPTITNNLFTGNSSEGLGGALAIQQATVTLTGNTFSGNSAVSNGGSCYFDNTDVEIANTILWENSAPTGAQIWGGGNTSITIRYSDVQDGESGVHLQGTAELDWGAGMLDVDPMFISGPEGDFYLSHTACGDPDTSPCVDTADPAGEMIWGSTRRDCCCDSLIPDMGFHYPGLERLLVGPGPSPANPPVVRAFRPEQDAIHEYEKAVYGAPSYGVNVSSGQVDGDGMDELLTGAGPGDIYGPHVRGFNLVEGRLMPVPGLSFLAYGTHRFGVNVASGDIDGDGYDEIITGAGPGAVFGPHVRGWNFDGNGTVTPIGDISYFAYGTPKWGVNVAAGDIDGDGFDEIVTGAGPGTIYGPHVRGWNVDDGPATAMPGVSFLAYGTNQYGVNVSCGDIDGDGIDEIVTGPGPGVMFGAHIRGWNIDGGTVSPMSDCSVIAWPPGDVRYGANVFAGADLNGDGRDEIIVGAGPDPVVPALVKVYSYNGSNTTEWISLQAFPDWWTHGAIVGAGRF